MNLRFLHGFCVLLLFGLVALFLEEFVHLLFIHDERSSSIAVRAMRSFLIGG